MRGDEVGCGLWQGATSAFAWTMKGALGPEIEPGAFRMTVERSHRNPTSHVWGQNKLSQITICYDISNYYTSFKYILPKFNNGIFDIRIEIL